MGFGDHRSVDKDVFDNQLIRFIAPRRTGLNDLL